MRLLFSNIIQNALLNYWNHDPSLSEAERRELNEKSTLPEPKERVTTGNLNKLNRKVCQFYGSYIIIHNFLGTCFIDR